MKNNWKEKLKELLIKQGLSPDDPEDEASQQIWCEQENFISSLLSSQLKEVLGAADEAIEEEYYNNWGKVKDSDQLGNIRCFADNIKERIKAELSQLAEGEK